MSENPKLRNVMGRMALLGGLGLTTFVANPNLPKVLARPESPIHETSSSRAPKKPPHMLFDEDFKPGGYKKLDVITSQEAEQQQQEMVVDYERKEVIGEIQGHYFPQILNSTDGTMWVRSYSYDDNNNPVSILTHGKVDGPIGQKSYREISAQELPGLRQIALGGDICYAAMAPKNLSSITVQEIKDGSRGKEYVLDEWIFGSDIQGERPMKGVMGKMEVVKIRGKEHIVIANRIPYFDANHPAGDHVKNLAIRAVLIDPTTGKQERVEHRTTYDNGDGSVFIGEEEIPEIASGERGILILDRLQAWSLSDDNSTSTWEMKSEPYEVGSVGGLASVRYDKTTGLIYFAKSTTDISVGSMKYEKITGTWQVVDSVKILNRSDSEPWNGVWGGDGFANMTLVPSRGGKGILFPCVVWFGPPFFPRYPGMLQEPIAVSQGKVVGRAAKNRKLETWERASAPTRDGVIIIDNALDGTPSKLNFIPIDPVESEAAPLNNLYLPIAQSPFGGER